MLWHFKFEFTIAIDRMNEDVRGYITNHTLSFNQAPLFWYRQRNQFRMLPVPLFKSRSIYLSHSCAEGHLELNEKKTIQGKIRSRA